MALPTAAAQVVNQATVSGGGSVPAGTTDTTVIGTTGPSISALTNAAGEGTAVAQNTWVAIYGLNLAPDSRTWQGSDFVNNQLPTKLDGVSVTVNGKSAYIYYISPTQVNVLTPLDSAQGSVTLQVTNNGSTSTAFAMQLQPYAPGLFQFGGSAYAAATHANGSLLGPAGLYPGSSTPANPGETIVLYGTGFGPTSPPIVSGSATQTGSLPVLPTVKICGVTATVQFAGVSGAGLYQLNVVVPGSVSGDCTTTVTYNGVTSNSALVSVTGSASNGSLQIQITGLPNGTSGSVSVTGPAGFSQSVTSNQTLQVAAGTYTVTANSVPVGSVSYAAFPVQQLVSVTSASATSVTISYSIVVPNTTMVLDQQGNQGLTVSNNGATVTLPSASQTAQALQPGSVLAIGSTASTPNGLLGKVVSVAQSGSQVVVQTTQASLIDAFQQVNFTFSTTLTPQNTPTLTPARPGVSMRWASAKAAAPRDSTPPSCTSDSSLIAEMIDVPIVKDSNGSLTLTGEIDLCPTLEFDPNVQAFPPRLNSLKATMSFGETAHVNITGSYHGSFSAESPIATAASEPITVWVGPVPIVLTPSLSIIVGVSAGFSVGATQAASVTGGFSYANGQTTDLNNSTSSFTEDPMALDAGLSVKAYTGVKMELEVEGVLSPSFSPDAYIQLNVNPLSSPWWTLSAGLEGDANVKIGILGAQLADFDDPSLFNISKVIAQASGGYTSGSAAPVLSTMTPTSANAGSQGLTITLTGTNFVPGATVAFSGTALATTYVSPTQLTAVLPSGALAVAGTFQVTVTNPDQTATASNPLVFVVASVTTPNPVPAITTLSPSSAVAGASPLTVLINGTGFVAASTVTFHGTAHAATFLSASQLSISLTSADLANAGTHQVVVTNPAPGGGSSQPAVFTVQPAPVTPTLQSLTLSPATVVGGGSVTGTITLTGAAPIGGVAVQISSNNPIAQAPPFVNVSGGQSSATFPITTSTAPSVQTVTIRASLGNSVQTATLTVSSVVTSQNIFLGNTLDFQGTAVLDGATIHYEGEVVFNGPSTYATFGNLTDSASTVTVGANFNSQGTSINGNTATFPSIDSAISGYGNVNNGNPYVVVITAGSLSVTVSATDPGSPVTGTLQFTAGGVVHQTTFTGTLESCSGCILAPGTATLKSVSVSSDSVNGGFFVDVTVTLTTVASADTSVYLWSNNSSVPVPPILTVPYGQNSVTTIVTTTPVTSPQTVLISAGLGTVLQTATLSVLPTSLTNPWTQSVTIVGAVMIDATSVQLQCSVYVSLNLASCTTVLNASVLPPILLFVEFDQLVSVSGQSVTFGAVDPASVFDNLTKDPTGSNIQSVTSGTLTLTASSANVGSLVTGTLQFSAGGVTRQILLTATITTGQ
jgi:uncharacterized protein (TIGR03437 family)